MEFLYCEGMANAQPSTENYKIKETTVINKGDAVALDTKGYVIKASDSIILIGIAAESYPANDGLTPKKDTIRVINASNAVYRAYGHKMHFASGSTATAFYPFSYDSTNGIYDQCVLVLASKSVDSENTDEIGTIRYVESSYLESSDSFVMYVSKGGVPHPDDVYAVLPSIGDTNVEVQIYGNEDFNFTTSEGAFRCVGHDLSVNNLRGIPSCYLMINRHVSNAKTSY